MRKMAKTETKVSISLWPFGFSTTLTVIFVIAKILGYINWSWWLVFMPLIVRIALGVIGFILAIVVFVIFGK